MIKALRTPDDAFLNLPAYPWPPNYISLDQFGLRMHYLDEGPTDGEVLLLLHGIPTWSYIFRKMIPGLIAAGYRVIVPDLIGFGKSDKPIHPKDITFDAMTDWFEAFLLKMKLTNISCFLHDWGGILGLQMAAKYPALFSRLSLGNTFLPTGAEPLTSTFKTWKTYLNSIPTVPIGDVIEVGTFNHIEANVSAAYNAPFPNEQYKTVLKKLPFLIPDSAEHPNGLKNKAYWNQLTTLDIPVQTIFTKNDPITAGWEKIFSKRLSGSLGQPHKILTDTSHFYQEDHAITIAHYLLEFLNKNPIS